MTLARRFASLMFSTPPEKVSDQELEDAIGELANMTGGNLESMLPEPSTLSLPIVVEGIGFKLRVPWSRQSLRLAFECGGQPMFATLHERALEVANTL